MMVAASSGQRDMARLLLDLGATLEEPQLYLYRQRQSILAMELLDADPSVYRRHNGDATLTATHRGSSSRSLFRAE